MAQPHSAPPPQCPHCQGCAYAQPAEAQLCQAPLPQAAPEEVLASSCMQPSAPALSFAHHEAIHEAAPSAPQATVAPPPAPANVPLLARPVPPPPTPAARGAQQLKVLVPGGISAGQHLQFTTPDGQSMFVTAQQDFPPNSHVMVQYQPRRSMDQGLRLPGPGAGMTAAGPPLPVVDPDAQATNCGWALYGLGWLSCCFFAPLAPALWIGLAVSYFCCMSPQLRAQRPRQRGPAVAAGATCCGLAAVGACFMLIGGMLVLATAAQRDDGHLFPHGNHSGPPGHHHPFHDGGMPDQHLRGAVLTGKPFFESAPYEMNIPAEPDSFQQGLVAVPAAPSTVAQGVSEVMDTSETPCVFGKAVQKLKLVWAAKKAAHHEAMKRWTGSLSNSSTNEGAEEHSEHHEPCPFKTAAEKLKQWWGKKETSDILE